MSTDSNKELLSPENPFTEWYQSVIGSITFPNNNNTDGNNNNQQEPSLVENSNSSAKDIVGSVVEILSRTLPSDLDSSILQLLR